MESFLSLELKNNSSQETAVFNPQRGRGVDLCSVVHLAGLLSVSLGRDSGFLRMAAQNCGSETQSLLIRIFSCLKFQFVR